MARSTALAVGVVALALAVPAVAAISSCHPDPAGTRVLQLHGQVTGYSVNGSTATIALRTNGACTTVTWTAAGSTHDASCAIPHPAPSSADGVRIIRPAPGVDLPDRLVTPSGRAWPLPVRVRPFTLQVAGDLAAYEALGGHGLWVTRLSDGQTTFVAPVKSGRPILDGLGAFYIDHVDKAAPPNKPVAKFVPTSALESELAEVGAPQHTSGPIRAFSMDGTNMALAVAGSCDTVFDWSIAWRSFHQVSENDGVTCAALGASRRISQIALGGNRAQWVTAQNGRPVIVAADDIGCREWVVGRPADAHRVAIAADGTMLAFTVGGRVTDVGADYRAFELYPLQGITALAADGPTTAAMTNQSVTIHDAHAVRETFRVRHAEALAVRGSTVVTTTSAGRLNVYRRGVLTRSWPLPVGARPGVDLQFGIAVVGTRSGVYAIDIGNGRTALLASTPAPARTQIESIGVGYVYSVGNRGTAALIPMSSVEAALGR